MQISFHKEISKILILEVVSLEKKEGQERGKRRKGRKKGGEKEREKRKKKRKKKQKVLPPLDIKERKKYKRKNFEIHWTWLNHKMQYILKLEGNIAALISKSSNNPC